MAWVTKDSVETYTPPEAPKEYTRKEKAANWWHYNKMIVAVVIAAVVLVAVFIKDTVLQTRPDVKIGRRIPSPLCRMRWFPFAAT